ncbi:hypothetical protein DO70_6348 [Burkholderia pseudomallei]|nr:hypothetical protein DO70_6348 [Burkholderia pseudomallei]
MHDEVDVVERDREAVRQVLHLVEVGQDDRDLVAFLHGPFAQPEGRRLRRQVDDDLPAVPLDAAVLRVLHRERELVEVVDLPCLDDVAAHDDRVVRLGIRRMVGHEQHLLAADVDQLRAVRMQRPDGQVAVLRELVVRDEELAVRLLRLAHRREAVARLVVHVDPVDDDFRRLLALVRLDRFLEAPLDDLAVEKERRVRVALAVEAGMQRPEADLRLRDHRVARLLELAREPLEHQLVRDQRRGGRELARARVVLAVGRRVHAVRVLRHAHVAGEGRLRIGVRRARAVDDGHGRVAHLEELAVLHRFLDARDVEEHARVALGRHHFLVMHAVLGVVLVRARELAVIRRRDEIHVAVDLHLPARLHRLRVDAGEQAVVLLRVVQVAAVVRVRNVELVAAEHARRVVDRLVERIALVGEDAVKALHVRQRRDRVALHRVEAHARDARIDLVVHEDVLAVVRAVRIGHVHVVRVAREVFELAVGLGADDLARFVRDAPAGHAVDVVDGNAPDLAPGRQAVHADVARMAAARERVVRIELARMHFVLAEVDRGGRTRAARRARARAARRGGRVAALVAAREAERQARAREPRDRRRGEEPAPPRVLRRCRRFGVFLRISHHILTH